MWKLIVCLLSALSALAAAQAANLEGPLALREVYAHQVDRKLVIPEPEQAAYAELALQAMQKAVLLSLPAQYFLLVDRNPQVQAALLFWLSDYGTAEFIGASPASTGKANGFDYFETPLGVFDHAAANEDFRATGSVNGNGIRGYGAKGMRVYDFGWVTARQFWRDGSGEMRLQLHSTDLERLEPLLGTTQSKGCIRIPASLNRLLDHYGLLDAGYERALRQGRKFWLLSPDREPTPWSGRYLIVIESRHDTRPEWAPLPVELPPSLPATEQPTSATAATVLH